LRARSPARREQARTIRAVRRTRESDRGLDVRTQYAFARGRIPASTYQHVWPRLSVPSNEYHRDWAGEGRPRVAPLRPI
jgi:hypothetical protein